VLNLRSNSSVRTARTSIGWRVMIVAKAHGFAGLQTVQGTKNGGMPKALGNAAGVERIDRVGRQVKMGL
jgi:hypothetical protein